MINVYSLRNRKGSFYEQPMFRAEAPEDLEKLFQRVCLLDPEQAKKSHYDEDELFHLGKFDDLTGEFALFDKPVFVVDLGQFFKESDNHE